MSRLAQANGARLDRLCALEDHSALTDPLLEEQIAYYRARAPEYDEWFLRQGRYDLGQEQNARWRGELEDVLEALASFGPRGRVLELAGGTGFWTALVARTADALTVVDASPESLDINRRRVGDPAFATSRPTCSRGGPTRRTTRSFSRSGCRMCHRSGSTGAGTWSRAAWVLAGGCSWSTT